MNIPTTKSTENPTLTPHTARSKYFGTAETACRCGCGLDNWSQETMDKMHLAREIYGRPIVVSSWCRCPVHNAKIGGSPTSSHPTGVAVDIDIKATIRDVHVHLEELIKALYRAGFRRIGLPIHKIKLHVDNDPTKPEALWFY